MSDNATIRRAKHDGKNPYFVMRRDTAQDQSISAEALGVLTEVLSRPNDWQVRVKQLTDRVGLGRDKTYRILNELITARYVERIQHRDESGRVVSVEYIVHEAPFTEKPDTAEPDTENTDNTNKRVKQSTELQKLPVAPTGSTAGQSSTPVESRTVALRDYGNRVAEHIEALPPVSIDDFGKTDPAEGYAVAPPPARTEPLEEVKTALAELFGWKHEGVLQNYGRMLRGIVSKRKTAYDEYAFIGQPVSADELRAFVASWKRQHPGLDLPQTPDAMARHVSAYRASVTNTAPGGSDDPFSGFTIE